MDAFDSLRKLLQSQAEQAGEAAGLTNLSFPGEAERRGKDGDPWGTFWHRTGKTRPTLGGGRKGFKMTAGIYQFTLYVPEKTGSGPLTRIGDKLQQWFDSQNWKVPPDGSIVLGSATVDVLPMAKNGNLVALVYGDFDYTHRNVDATPHGY